MSKKLRVLSLVVLLGIITGCTRSVPGSGSGPSSNATPSPEAIAEAGSDPGTGSESAINTLGTVEEDIQFYLDGHYFDAENKSVRYEYDFENDSQKSYIGPIEIIHDKTQINCPAINQVGNKDDKFDEDEDMHCEGVYTFTQADFDAGKVISRAQVSLEGGAFLSKEVVTEIPLTQSRELTLKTVTDPSSYNQVGQTITLTYEIINNGNVTLGPAQFTIDEALLDTPPNCGPASSSLLPTESILCAETYTVTQADLDSGSVTSNATATDGTTTSEATMVTVTKSNSSQPNPTNLTPGTTIQHTVIPGDWLMQIARCYGADYEKVRSLNPHIYAPNLIWSGQVVSVPNIGSAGTIYGSPCVVFHTAVSGDTWESLAQQYNARVDILKRVNPGGLFTGANIKVPINSAGGSSSQVPGTKRITIPAGATSATGTGTLTASGKVSYLVAGKNGQTMSVTLTAPAGEVAMGIYDPSGAILLNPADLTLTWNGKLTVDGDYRIELSGAAGITDKNYSLKVELTTLVGTLERVTNIRSESGGSLPRKPVVFNGALYFGAYEEDGSDRGLWKYDGTSVSLVAGNLGGPFGFVGPAFLTAYNGALYFEADGGNGAGLELWKYDGIAPPSLVYDIHKGPEGSNPAYLAVYNGELYFNADDGEGAGRELWKYDGTNPPTLVEDIWDGPGNSDPYDLAVYNGELYFNADDGEGAGEELWKYDSTNPPSLAEDIWDGSEGSSPLYLTVYNGALYFGADNGEGAGYELWKYDGASSPSLAADIRSGPESSTLQDIAVYDGALYFSADSDGAGYELWKYDGTDATPVADIGDGFGYPAVYNGALYFSADGGDGAGMQLWRYISPSP